MRFNKIKIENFGPFKLPVSIDFKSRDGVSIIWGGNGRGKTTILNAFNFVLNGQLKERDRKINDFISFINEDGMAEGKYSYKVSLEMEDAGNKYRIVRTLCKIPGVDIPKSNSDFYVSLTVNENGNILSTADAEHFVNGIMTEEVSRFFLFDGELLMEYEELLNENSVTGGSIKNSIEQILGMPILAYGEIDANEAASEIATEARKVVQNEDTVKKYSQKIDELTESLKHQEDELNRLQNNKNTRLQEKARLQRLVADTDKLREYSSKKRDIESKINAQLQICENEKSKITLLLKDSWKWMITPVLKTQNELLKSEIQLLQSKEQSAKGQEVIINFIKEAIDDVHCPVCDHEVLPSEKALLKNKLSVIQNSILGLTEPEKIQLEKLREKSRLYTTILDTNDHASELKSRYENYLAARVKAIGLKERDLKEVENNLESLKKNASGEDERTAFEHFDKLGKVISEINLYEEGIKNVIEKIEEIKNNIKKLDAVIVSKSGNKDVALAKKKVEFAENVAAIFREGIDVYRDKLSKDVERDATEIFLAMNTEDDYAGLKINDNYGLTIMRHDGKAVSKRSAGWEHMVAFALIGALHKNAPFDGPVIMDSPFYRLDKFNTASMVKALPLIANQVLMLPYPGEIDPDTTRRDIGHSIVQELELSRIKSNESTIKEMSNNG